MTQTRAHRVDEHSVLIESRNEMGEEKIDVSMVQMEGIWNILCRVKILLNWDKRVTYNRYATSIIETKP